MADIQAVSFGLNGTLWDNRSCCDHAIEIVLPKLLPLLPEDDPGEVIAAFNAVFIDLVKKYGLTSDRTFSRRERFERLLDLYGVEREGLAQRLSQTYDSACRLAMRGYVRDGVLLSINHLIRSGIKVGVVANGTPAIQRQTIKTLGLEQYLDFTVIGGIEGYNKPDPRLFQRAMQLTGVEAENMVHVGDGPITDVLGASRAGITPVWLNIGERQMPENFPRPEYTIYRMTDLISALFD